MQARAAEAPHRVPSSPQTRRSRRSSTGSSRNISLRCDPPQYGKETGRTGPGPAKNKRQIDSRSRRVLIWGSLTVVVAVILIFCGRFSYAPVAYPDSKADPNPEAIGNGFAKLYAECRGQSAGNPSVTALPTAPPSGPTRARAEPSDAGSRPQSHRTFLDRRTSAAGPVCGR